MAATPARLLVGEVARVVARPAKPRVRRDDRPGRDRQDVVDASRATRGRCRRASRAPRSAGPTRGPASVRPPFATPVRRAAHLRVEEVRRRDHPVAGIGERRRRSRGRPPGSGRPRWRGRAAHRVGSVARAARKRLEVLARLEDPQPPAGAVREGVRAARLVERPGQQARPGARRASRWPARRASTSSLRSSLRSRLRWRGLFVVTASTWSATLPSIIRGTSLWPRVAARQQVATPEQRVGVEVGDGAGCACRAAAAARRRRRRGPVDAGSAGAPCALRGPAPDRAGGDRPGGDHAQPGRHQRGQPGRLTRRGPSSGRMRIGSG